MLLDCLSIKFNFSLRTKSWDKPWLAMDAFLFHFFTATGDRFCSFLFRACGLPISLYLEHLIVTFLLDSPDSSRVSSDICRVFRTEVSSEL